MMVYNFLQKHIQSLSDFYFNTIECITKFFVKEDQSSSLKESEKYESAISEINKAYNDYMQKLGNFVCYVTKDNLYKYEAVHTYPDVDSACIIKKGSSLGGDTFTPQYSSDIVVAVKQGAYSRGSSSQSELVKIEKDKVFQTEIENNRVFNKIEDYYNSIKSEGYSQCDGPDGIRSLVRYFHLTEDQWQECNGIANSYTVDEL